MTTTSGSGLPLLNQMLQISHGACISATGTWTSTTETTTVIQAASMFVVWGKYPWPHFASVAKPFSARLLKGRAQLFDNRDFWFFHISQSVLQRRTPLSQPAVVSSPSRASQEKNLYLAHTQLPLMESFCRKILSRNASCTVKCWLYSTGVYKSRGLCLFREIFVWR